MDDRTLLNNYYAMGLNLTSTQARCTELLARCTELLEENRALKRRHKEAAVGLMVRRDRLTPPLFSRARAEVLAVWNKSHNGWGMPGGKVEPGESILQALERELREEIDVWFDPVQIPQCVHSSQGDVEHDRHVFLFRIASWIGEPRAMEEGAPIKWMHPIDYLAVTPFPHYYAETFRRLELV